MNDSFNIFEKYFWRTVEGILHDNMLKQENYVLDYIKGYSSKAHLYNIYKDINTVKKNIPVSFTVLDFGCGMGFISAFLSDAGYRVTGVETVLDKSAEGFFKNNTEQHISNRNAILPKTWDILRGRRETLAYELYDGRRLPYPAASFDVVMAYAVIEHIPKEEIQAILDQIHRILRPGGKLLIFQLPQRYSYTEYIARKLHLPSHENLWTLREIESVLRESNFTVVGRRRSDMLFNQPHAIVNRLFPVLKFLDRILTMPPFFYLAHHLNIIAQSTDDEKK